MAVGLEKGDLSQAPWGVLIALYPQTKWHGLASWEGKTLTERT